MQRHRRRLRAVERRTAMPKRWLTAYVLGLHDPRPGGKGFAVPDFVLYGPASKWLDDERSSRCRVAPTSPTSRRSPMHSMCWRRRAAAIRPQTRYFADRFVDKPCRRRSRRAPNSPRRWPSMARPTARRLLVRQGGREDGRGRAAGTWRDYGSTLRDQGGLVTSALAETETDALAADQPDPRLGRPHRRLADRGSGRRLQAERDATPARRNRRGC